MPGATPVAVRPGSTRYAGGRAGKAATVTVIVGTSGWQYRDWRGRFYPPRLPQRLWLEHYAAHFDTVEVNNAFYRLPERRVFEAWRSRTPPQFVVTTKASRFLSHVKRLAFVVTTNCGGVRERHASN